MAEPSAMGLGGRASLKIRPATILVAKGPDAGRQARIEPLTFVVGVGESADLRLTDSGVAREHLRMILGPDGLHIRDEGSKGGTFVSGIRVRDLTVTSDAVVVIGGTTLAITFAPAGQVLPLSTSDRFSDVIGPSTSMRAIFAQLERAAPTDHPILIEGEGGTGKDLLARAIHARSARNDMPFVVVDCSAMSAHLLDGELFGYERGAPGNDRGRDGLVDEASDGTLFLDEIGELPLALQSKVLRLVDHGESFPVGATVPRKINVRVLTATNRRLAEAARVGEFRDDLARRLATVRVGVPPLRERTADILPIARAMYRSARRDVDAELPPDVTALLLAYAWPGNVRELRNVIERQARPRDPVPPSDLSGLAYHDARKLVVDRFEEDYLPKVLERAEGVATRAAELAGIARPSFYRMLERIRSPKSTR